MTTNDDDPWREIRARHARYVAGLSGSPAGAEPTSPDYPPLATQLANAAKAAGRFVASGLETVDQAEFDRRKAICESCPSNQYDAGADRCVACGCHLSIKPWGKVEDCPLGHWSRGD